MNTRSTSFLATVTVAWLSACVPLLAQDTAAQKKILRSSDWSMLIATGGPPQPAGMRIRDGNILPGNTKLNNVVGRAAFDVDGNLVITLVNHPKGSGVATVTKVSDGKWEGFLVQGNLKRRLELTRTK